MLIRTKRDIDFVLDVLPPTEGDAAMLRQVWVNLVDNAMKFTRHNPRARVEVGGALQRLHRQDEFEGSCREIPSET